MKKFLGVFVLGAFVGLLMLSCGKSPNSVQPSLSDQVGTGSLAKAEVWMLESTNDIEDTRFVPCAAGGAGEFVRVSGPVHFVWRYTIDANGGYHGSIIANWMGVTGEGLTTGDTYVVPYAGNLITQDLSGKVEEESISNVINQLFIGTEAKFHWTHHIHATIHADGSVTTYIEMLKADCK